MPSESVDPTSLAARIPKMRHPPVQRWNPPLCGDIDIRIARDGVWHYMGSPIGRQRLVRLFASVLRRDDDAYYLVTPVEKMRIQVEDAPFVAVELLVQDGEIGFRTNVDDHVVVDADHPLWVETSTKDGQPSPYVRVRDRLDALISRSVYYQLVNMGTTRGSGEGARYGVVSGGTFYPLGKL